MNAIDILGAILGRRTQGSGGKIVKDVVKAERPRPKVERQPPPPRRAEYEPQTQHDFTDDDNDLEDLMRDAYQNFDQQTGGAYRSSLPTDRSSSRDSRGSSRSRSPSSDRSPSSRSSSRPEPRSFDSKPKPRDFGDPREQRRNEKAEVLIRAMIMSAKADGRVDQTEQDQIVGEVGGQLGQKEVEFLRQEFARPVNLPEFVRSVPRGMEYDVYTASLMAIDLDNNQEAEHLHELATAFGIPPEEVNRIHQRFDAPSLY